MSTGKDGLFDIILRKARRLLLPFIGISSLVFLPKALLAQYAIIPIEPSIVEYIHMLVFPRDNVIMYYWFLPTLFLIFCLATTTYALSQKTGLRINGYVVWIVLLLLNLFNPLRHIRFLCINDVAQNLVYFHTGYLLCNHKCLQMLLANSKVLLILFAALSVITTFINMHFYCLTTLISAFSGIALIVVMGKIYTDRAWHCLDHLFPCSYTIYLLSWFPQVFVYQYLGMHLAVPLPIVFCLSLVLGIYVPTAVHYGLRGVKRLFSCLL